MVEYDATWIQKRESKDSNKYPVRHEEVIQSKW